MTANNTPDLIRVFACEFLALFFSWISPVDSEDIQQLKQKPLCSTCTQREQLYKPCATNPATSNSNWFQIALTKGTFQVHRQIDLVQTHPLLQSFRKAAVVLYSRLTPHKSISWYLYECGFSLIHFPSWISEKGKDRKVTCFGVGIVKTMCQNDNDIYWMLDFELFWYEYFII